MTDLIFNDPDEARAWDMYVAGFALASDPYLYADQALLERRKRMAPAAQTVPVDYFPVNVERKS
jgi:hypothetical protein